MQTALIVGDKVMEKKIDYDYRRDKHLMVVSNVSAGVCLRRQREDFKPEVLKQMDKIYHDILTASQKPVSHLNGPFRIAGCLDPGSGTTLRPWRLGVKILEVENLLNILLES